MMILGTMYDIFDHILAKVKTKKKGGEQDG